MYDSVLMAPANESYLDQLIRSVDMMKTWVLRRITIGENRTSSGPGYLCLAEESYNTGSVFIQNRTLGSDIATDNDRRSETRDLVLRIKAGFGLNMTELATVLRVGRPTVYAWLNKEVDLRATNLRRLLVLADIASNVRIPPMLSSRTDGSKTLLDELAAQEVDRARLIALINVEQPGPTGASARLDSLLQGYERPADARHQLDIITGRPLSDDD